jgi:TIR domain
MPAFLSYNSANKSFVDGVFSALGPSIAEYDDKTFSAGKFNTEAIRDAIARSNLFVLFATRQSFDSGLVEYEINIANEFLASRRIRQILTFCIDGVSPSDVRRQSFWDIWRLKLRESLAPLVKDIMRLVVGAASGDWQLSVV